MRRRRLHKTPAQLEITAFINLIVVLVPFLLSTAVFSRLAVMELKLPAQHAAVQRLQVDDLQLEVVLRGDAIEVADRIGGLIQRLPRAAKGHDFPALGALMLQIKSRFPAETEVTLLAEPQTPYDHLVQAMDALRSSLRPDGARLLRAELFPRISIGDAPERRDAAATTTPAPRPAALSANRGAG